MESHKKEKITVLGAGLMGHGIAQVASQIGGYEVSLLDVKKEFLDHGMEMINASLGKFVEKGKVKREDAKQAIDRIHPVMSLSEAVKDSRLVIEAITEDRKVKLHMYRRLSEVCSDNLILASNTSSISITLLASTSRHPENVCGMHFFNPPQLMPLVEITKGNRTSDSTVEFIRQVSKAMGKETVLCKKDSPGFIVNRIFVPALNEAVMLLQEGVADPEDIDKAIKLGLNWPMGPFQLLDYVGIDTALNAMQILMDEFQDSKYRPALLMREMVRAGLLGRKTGKGFYDWGATD